MRVTMLWYGGSNYATPDPERDAETFSSLKAARDAFWCRSDFDPYYPCVENSEAHIYVGARVTDCPDFILTLGPRGGVRQERY